MKPENKKSQKQRLATQPKRTFIGNHSSDQMDRRKQKVRATTSSKEVTSQKKRKQQNIKAKRLTKKQRLILKKNKRRKFVFEFVITVLLTLFVMVIISYFTFSIPKVEGYSMTPTVNDKDRLFVNKWGQIKRFSLIYFKDPKNHEVMIRRVIALPGEDFFYEKGKLYINGEEIVERFMSSEKEPAEEKDINSMQDFSLQELQQEKRIPKDKYVVLGDNRRYSTDSRYFGFVSEKDIIGVVTMRVFPIHEMTHF